MLETKELPVAIHLHSMEKNTMEVNGYQQLFGYQHSRKKEHLNNLFNLTSFYTFLRDVFMWNTKDDILKNIGKQTTFDPIDFHWINHSDISLLCSTEERKS